MAQRFSHRWMAKLSAIAVGMTFLTIGSCTIDDTVVSYIVNIALEIILSMFGSSSA